LRFSARSLQALTLTKEEEEGKAKDFMNRYAVTKHVQKRAYAEGFFEMVNDFNMTVFAMVMERPDKAPYEGPELLQCHHRYLFNRVERFMAEEHPNHMALPIYDALDRVDTHLRRRLQRVHVEVDRRACHAAHRPKPVVCGFRAYARHPDR